MSLPFIVQENNNDCALACFAMIYKFYFKQNIELNDLKQMCDLSDEKGINLLALKELAIKHYLNFEIYKITFNQLEQLKIENPIIIQILNETLDYHFVIIYKKKKNYFLVADPKEKNLAWCEIKDFNQNFTGIIVNCYKDKNTKKIANNSAKFNCFSIPKYFICSINILVTNLFLVLIFFITQVCYKAFINQIIVNNNYETALLLLITFFVINIIYLLVNFIFDRLSKIFYLYFSNCLINYFYLKWFSLRVQTVKNFNNSYFLQIYQDISSLSNVYTNNILELIISFITMITVSIVLSKISGLILTITLLTGIINLIFNYTLMKIQSPIIKKSIDKKMMLQNTIINTNQNYEDSSFRNLIFNLKNNLNIKTREVLEVDSKLMKNNGNNSLGTNFIKQFLNFISLYLLLNLIFKEKLAFSQLVFISSINIYILNFFYNLGSFTYSYPEFKRAYNRFNSFMNLPNKNVRANSLRSNIGKFKEINFVNCKLKINNKIIFNHLNLKFSGHSLLIGKNGIGKTTLLSLISSKYECLKGYINIDHYNINAFGSDVWERNCIYLSSNSNVMLGSVLENILSFNVTEEKLLQFNKLNIEGLLQKFNLKLTDYCNTYSSNMSQGQKQIIIFLSLFFHDWKIILLDEILSNVNQEIKLDLINMLKKYFSKSIIIYASHDMTLKNKFDYIIDLNSIKRY